MLYANTSTDGGCQVCYLGPVVPLLQLCISGCFMHHPRRCPVRCLESCVFGTEASGGGGSGAAVPALAGASQPVLPCAPQGAAGGPSGAAALQRCKRCPFSLRWTPFPTGSAVLTL